MPDEPTTVPPLSTEGAPVPAPPPTASEQVAAHHLDAGHHHGHAQLPPFKFLDELKRRNVGRVAILYIVVSYVVLEVFEMFFHLLEMPPWTGRAAVLIAVLGFPIALLIAWAYEITPEGLKPTEEVPAKQSIRAQTGKRLDRAIIVVLAVALTYFVVDKFWLSKRTATLETGNNAENSGAPATASSAATPGTSIVPPSFATNNKSVAVLPFLDMSEKHDQEYFSDGLAEELINKLVRVQDLRVPARTSSFYFKGKQTTIKEIAAALGVAHVLEGSVRKSGNTLRITAQLIRVDNGYHLWSETYDRKVQDIFKTQDDIASSVVSALQIVLNGSSAIRPIGTSNVEAYTLYLQGKAMAQHGIGASPEEKVATEYFRRAVRLDPSFALAWERLSVQLTDQGQVPEARQAINTALRLDPNLPEAHVSMARLLIIVDWNLAHADAELRRALELDPNNSYALSWYGDLAIMGGNIDKGLEYVRRSVQLDPLNPPRVNGLADALWNAGQFVEANKTFERFLTLNPAAEPYRRCTSAGMYLMVGDPAAALSELDRDPNTPGDCPVLPRVLDSLGRKSEADAVLSGFVRNYGSKFPFNTAAIYANRQDLDSAFHWLEIAYKQRDFDLLYLNVAPELKNLRSDPRFVVLLSKMHLPR